MLNKTGVVSFLAGVLVAAISMAQTPAASSPPAGSTGLCKDGSYWSGASKRGACSGHHGVQTWYATTATPSAPATAPAAAAPAVATAPTAPAAPAAVAPAAKTPVAAPTVTQAAGGGAGQVWANKNSKVYHCSTDRWYGKTKNGQYLTEADAVAQGYRPDHGKACH